MFLPTSEGLVTATSTVAKAESLNGRAADVAGVGVTEFGVDAPEGLPVFAVVRTEFGIAGDYRVGEGPLVWFCGERGSDRILRDVRAGSGKGAAFAVLFAQDAIMRLDLEFRGS